jgi:hypothetical protein
MTVKTPKSQLVARLQIGAAAFLVGGIAAALIWLVTDSPKMEAVAFIFEATAALLAIIVVALQRPARQEL